MEQSTFHYIKHYGRWLSTGWWRIISLHWRHNVHDGVSNHQPHSCLRNRLFRRRSKKTSKLRVTGLCVGNSPGSVTRILVTHDDVIKWKHFPRNWPFVWGIHWDRWIPRTKGQLRGKCFHLMTSSCVTKIRITCFYQHPRQVVQELIKVPDLTLLN